MGEGSEKDHEYQVRRLSEGGLITGFSNKNEVKCLKEGLEKLCLLAKVVPKHLRVQSSAYPESDHMLPTQFSGLHSLPINALIHKVGIPFALCFGADTEIFRSLMWNLSGKL